MKVLELWFSISGSDSAWLFAVLPIPSKEMGYVVWAKALGCMVPREEGNA